MSIAPKKSARKRTPLTPRQKVQAHRDRLRAQGFRPIQVWVPDVRTPAFAAAARRQSTRIAASKHAAADEAFVDAISVWFDE